MIYEIVTLNNKYRGLCRVITTHDFPSRNFKKLFSLYLDYIEFVEKRINNHTFDQYMEKCQEFRNLGVNCELIACADKPIINFDKNKLIFLGIDVVCDIAESLLEDSDCIANEIKPYLNENGLCSDAKYVDFIINHSDIGSVEWKPCWVYSCE